MTRQPSAGFAQFFPAAPRAARDRATEREKARAKTHESATTPFALPLAGSAGAGDTSSCQSPVGDGSPPDTSQPQADDRGSPVGDTLHTLGSASSYESTGSSVFSAAARQQAPNGTSQIPASNLTPLTTVDSPSHVGHTTQAKSNMSISQSTDQLDNPESATLPNGSLPASFSRVGRIPARSASRSRKGIKCTYDPNTDRALKDKKSAKPVLEEFGLNDDDAPPSDPRLDENGGHMSYINTDFHLPKARLRHSPYNLKPYPFDTKTSLGPGPPTQILVIGFNPLINFARVSQAFASFGDVAESSNKMHPETGSYLGFATFRYKDTLPSRSRPSIVKGMDAARRAVRTMHGQKIESHQIRVEFDPEGKKSRRMMEEILKKEKDSLATTQASHIKAVPTGPRSVAPTVVPGPPPLAPRGPAMQRPTPPYPTPIQPSKPVVHSKPNTLVENELVAPQVAGIPHIFVPCAYVPVMASTVPHMKKRLKAYSIDEIRLDRTGYYILFPNTSSGRNEALRCQRFARGTEFFNYEFHMLLRLPAEERDASAQPRPKRTPSPERKPRVDIRAREDKDRRRREEENDLEEEKRQRAKNFDPVKAAAEVIGKELAEHLLKHIRTRVAAPALTSYLNPANHIANRRKIGLEDSADATLTARAGDESPRIGTPNSGADPIERRTGRLEVSALPRIRKVKGNKRGLQQNQAITELYGRKRAAINRNPVVRSLHHRLQSYDSDAESDDDGDARVSVARDTEEPESRPRSRMSTDDDLSRDELASWGPGEDDSMTDVSLAVSKKRKLEPEAQTATKRQKKSDEELFGVTLDHIDTDMSVADVPVHDISEEATPDVDMERAASRSETPTLAAGKALLKQKGKRKSKKQMFEEREAKKQLETDRVRVEEVLLEETEEAEEPEDPIADVKTLDEPAPEPPVEISDFDLFSHDVTAALELPDDFTLDLSSLGAASLTALDAPEMVRLCKRFNPASLEDPLQWLWRRNRIRDVNLDPTSNEQRRIDGYYVANSTGSARTEGVKKILNSEKSKYLPHHIKVQKAREAREAKKQKDGKDAAVVPAPPAPAKGNSRANRASNRRHVTLLQDELKMSTDPDVFKFNALKKRKKPVKFARSAIHNWGLYTEENINKDDMIIEYVGEQVRQQISEIREKKYLKQGMGSSYLFRIDEDTVIDATKKGGIARFINHSCMPNCTAKIIKVDGSKRIVIYALRDIPRNEELTYDYKFEREINSLDRIPCLCGTALCKGFLN